MSISALSQRVDFLGLKLAKIPIRKEVAVSDESEPSWLEPQFELKHFRLGSARDLFSSARFFFFQLENQKSAIFYCQDFFFLISHAFSLYFWFSLLQIIPFLLKVTNLWVEKKLLELKKLYIKKNPARFQLENCRLDSA